MKIISRQIFKHLIIFFKVSTPLRYPLISMIDEIENKSLKGIFDFRFKRKNILILDLVFLI
jgi:hypothetical protein